MTGKVLTITDILTEDREATRLTEQYMDWKMRRRLWESEQEETRRYVFATDTSQTSNSSLPWKNKTTIPKLCQIRDNLLANYLATLFPQDKNIEWKANEYDPDSVSKKEAIENYILWAMDQPKFKTEIIKALSDYIDEGNCFGTVEWIDERVEGEDKITSGFVGPAIKRINPFDMVMNPIAEDFVSSPKFIRSVISMGELKELLERMSNDENRDAYENLYKYMKELRFKARTYDGDWQIKDNFYAMDGFTSFREYLQSDTVEVLTFYGDIYDPHNDDFQKNRVIMVVDRHKVIVNKPNPSYFGYAPIFQCVWRQRPDNLWGQGPLHNLVGMQYRIDHVENMKADIFDLVTYPVQKVKGFVEEYTWQPGEKIFVSDEGDVEIIQPQVQVLQANMEIQNLERLMEEMAGAPREAMGFRSPGEKTKYEVQSLENAASRIFQMKIKQFEEQFLEPLLNAMLELARRNMTQAISISVFDDEFKAQSFQELTPEDITGSGRIKPVAARNFAEQAQLVQNLNALASSPMWSVVQPHFSSIKLAKMYENTFSMKQLQACVPYIALAEQADAQRLVNVLQEKLQRETMTATGMGEDYDMELQGQPMPNQIPPEAMQQGMPQ